MSMERDLDEPEQREWEIQERGVRADRARERSSGDAAVAEYRLIARALRNPPLAPLPEDFAACTAARAERRTQPLGERLEIWLERSLIALLAGAGAAAVLVYGGDSWSELLSRVPERAVPGIRVAAGWGVVIAACVGLSLALTPARKR